MAESQQPLIRVIEFNQTFEKMAKRDEFGDKVLDDKGQHILELKEEDWVTYAPAHNPISTQTKARIRHLMPTTSMRDDKSGEKSKFIKFRWGQIEPAYEAWKQGHEIPINGTPLGSWAGINAAQAEALKQISIRTVEEVRDMTDTMCDRVRMPNVRDVRKSAHAFLDGKGKASSAAKIAELEAKYEAVLELLEEKTIPPAPTGVDEEVLELRSQLDEKGIAWHNLHKVPRLTELLTEAA